MQENLRVNKIKKVSAVLLVVLFCLSICASFICAIMLPFSKRVAMAAQSDVVLQDASGASVSADVPVYADGVGKGTYIDFSSFQSVSMYDYNGSDLVYGFYYDTSYKFDFDFRDNTVLTGSIKSYNVSFYENMDSSLPSYSFSMLNNYSSVGSSSYASLSIRFPYGTSSNTTTYYLMFYSKSDTNFRITYVLNGFYFNQSMSKIFFSADFKSTEYAKHMYLITQSVDDFTAELFQLRQDNVRLMQEKEALQSQYSDLLNGMDFSVFNSVNLDSASVYGTNYKATATQITINNNSYSGYWYRRSNVESGFRLCLTELNIGSTMVKGTDIKCTYDALYKYNGDVPQDIYVGLAFTTYGVSALNESSTFYQRFIPYSEWLNGSFIVSLPFDVNYIAFDLFDSNYQPLGLNYNINTGIAEGLFISNFVVSGRGSNFKIAIDNANKQGFNSGYEQGFTQGKNIGYSLGSKDQGDYTFLGLIGAVIDAPIEAFKGLFDFEILGVDMSSFVLSLLTLSVVIIVIRMALGGK